MPVGSAAHRAFPGNVRNNATGRLGKEQWWIRCIRLYTATLFQISNRPSRNIHEDVTPEDDGTCAGLLRRDAVAVFKKKSQRVPARRKFKTVVTSSAGSPLDKTDYQTIKGMVTPMDILEPGGALIVASACSEGFGSKEFRAAQRRLIELGPDKFLATLTAKSLADVVGWQTEMRQTDARRSNRALYVRLLGRGVCFDWRRNDR